MKKTYTSETAAREPGLALFQELPLGAIQPAGWLRDQLRLQADGLTGHLDELWPDVGPTSAWLQGNGEDWERGPYYCDGLLPLAYLLQDEQLIAKAQHWIEATFASQQESGQFGPLTNDDWWSRMVMLKVLVQYYGATHDVRVLPFMTRYFQYQLAGLPERQLRDWGKMRGAENLLCIYWLYEHSPEPFLLELAEIIFAQSFDWENYLTEFPCKERETVINLLTHVVNVAMGLKFPALSYVRDGQARHLQAIRQAIANLMQYHGQVHGMFSGDEHLSGLEPTQGTELCAVVEMMFSLEQIIRIYGEGEFADRLETLAYNALPATITADMRAHQYDQQPNQVLCTIAPRNWVSNGDASNIFGLEPNFGCCTANMHQGWPKFTQSLWMTTQEGGIAAIAYAPCTVTTRLNDGTEVTIEERTTYPFEETVRFTLHLSKSTAFPLQLRIPEWCEHPSLSLNGQAVEISKVSKGFITLHHIWSEGDTLELVLPMKVRIIERPHQAVGVALGPLVFALQIDEEWTRIPGSAGFGDWEIRPQSPWNYALQLARGDVNIDFRVERSSSVHTVPFAKEQAAVRIHATAHRLPQWQIVNNSAGPIPTSPIKSVSDSEKILLIPYGCARLRLAEFPLVLTQ